jgi:pimeloyl-ACP methyl ester carboxylesterase
MHNSKASSVQQLEFVPAAVEDPVRWGSLDPGYLTVPDSVRAGIFYYPPTTDPAVVARDHQLKDTITGTQLADAAAELGDDDPTAAISQRVRVPTLLVVGEHDAMFFGPPDGPPCTEELVLAAETPYYAPETKLAARVIADTGHNLALHKTAPLAAEATLAWLADVVPPAP